MLVVSGTLVGLWVTAVSLQPSPNGFGTHQGLGLPPCSLVQWTGIRCPSCGMTTSWAHLIRGNLPASLWANTGGCLLGIVALAATPWCLAASLTGRWWLIEPDERIGLAVALSVFVVTVIDWVLRLAFA